MGVTCNSPTCIKGHQTNTIFYAKTGSVTHYLSEMSKKRQNQRSVNAKKMKKVLHEVSVKKEEEEEERRSKKDFLLVFLCGQVEHFIPFSFRNHPASAAVHLIPFCIFTL